MFVGASKQVNKGLKFAGGVLSKGFDSLGSFISKRVEKEEDKEVSADTKQNMKKIKEATKGVLGFAS